MASEDLKSRTPGPIDADSRAFVDRIRSRRDREDAGDTETDNEVDDTALPLDDRGSDLAGTVSQAGKDITGDADDQPDSDNPDDAGEDETLAPLD